MEKFGDGIFEVVVFEDESVSFRYKCDCGSNVDFFYKDEIKRCVCGRKYRIQATFGLSVIEPTEYERLWIRRNSNATS